MNEDLSALVTRAQDGDRDAFDELVRQYRRMLRGLVRVVGRKRTEEDDLIQEIFLRAWRSLPTLREPTRFLPWLQALARNVCLSDRRHHARRPEAASLEDEAVLTDHAKPTGIEEILNELPGDVQRVMRAKFVEDRSYREIASHLDLSLAHVRRQIEKGLRLVSRGLDPDSMIRPSQEIR